MTRHDAREISLHIIFAMDYFDGSLEQLCDRYLSEQNFSRFAEDCGIYGEKVSQKQRDYITEVVGGVYTHRAELDAFIEKYAVGWTISRLSKITCAILRLAFFECIYMSDVPTSAAINEAVELAKKYDDEQAAGFINGILGSFARSGSVEAADSPDETAEQPAKNIEAFAEANGESAENTEALAENTEQSVENV